MALSIELLKRSGSSALCRLGLLCKPPGSLPSKVAPTVALFIAQAPASALGKPIRVARKLNRAIFFF